MSGSGPVDLILHNAGVVTDGMPRGKARAVAASAGRIVAVGDDEDVLALSGTRTEVVDLRGQALLPGFIDAHVHLKGCAETYFSVDCGPSRATSIMAIQGLIRERVAGLPHGEWVRAHGYHQFYFDESRHPNRWDLDEAAPLNPVRLLHQNRHISVLNSPALLAAGINPRTPNPPGGFIERDTETGEPTGLLLGMNAWLSRSVVPPLSPDDLREGIRLASQSFMSQGVTCIHDAGVNNGIDDWRLFRDLMKSGDLPLRVRMMVGLEGLDAILADGLSPRCGDSSLKLGAVKLVADQNGGILFPPAKELASQARRANEAGFQVAIHAIAPKAIRAAIRALRTLGDGESRHRIEHCTYLSLDLIRGLAEVRAIVVSQPSFLYYNGYRYLSEVPPEKFAWVSRGRSIVRNGVRLVGSTDSPVVPSSVVAGIAAAVTRESQIGFVFGPRERISASQAVNMFTAAAAYASFEENEMGSIEAGNYADLVVLDKDPLSVRPEVIGGIRPTMLIIGGKTVWVREA